MENITRKQVDQIVVLLDKMETKESKELATILKNADVISKLYQYAYVESMYKIFSRFDNLEQLLTNLKYSYSHEKYLMEKKDAFEAVKGILEKAHKRQNEICDFEDSTLDQYSMGMCQDDEHYENAQDSIKLTDEEQKKFSQIAEEKGWSEAWDHFKDKINPDNQKLTLILNFNEDETKCMKEDGYYVCETCLEVITQNSDGGISCDLEMADDD